MEFIDYDKLISDKKNAIIDSYVRQYGESFRTLIESRFDSIRFCFFETPKRIIDYIYQKSSDDGKQITIEFLKELGFDISTIYDDYGSINSTDQTLSRMLEAFFPLTRYMTLWNINKGALAYFNGSEIDKSPCKVALRNLKISDEQIRKILLIFGKYKNRYLELYNPLISYVDELEQKIETLIEQYNRSGKNSSQDKEKLRYEIAKLCIINNFDLDEFEIGVGDYESLYTEAKALTAFVPNKSGQYVPIVYVSPLDKDFEFLDVLIDHEIRHALEYSIDGNVIKCGIGLTDLDTDENKYNYLNEVMTQKLSIESTMDRQQRGSYIFPRQVSYTGIHIDYDLYLDLITKCFPSEDTSWIRSRLLPNLDELYTYHSEEELDQIDLEIMPGIQVSRKKK